METSEKYAEEWEKFCKEDSEAWKKTNPPPSVANFPFSGGSFYNALERWSDNHRKHYMRVGEAWWNKRGFTVISWPRSRDPIEVAPLKKEEPMETTQEVAKVDICIAIFDEAVGIIGVADFDSDEKLSRVMAECKKKGLSVKTMNRQEAMDMLAAKH